jgi:transcriptional regulator GlxA family with amidase domain
VRRFDIVVFDGVDELDVVGPLEVLRRAAASEVGLNVRLVTSRPQALVRGAWGLSFVPDGVHAPGADVLLVPGGGWVSRSDVGAWGEVQRGDWPALLAETRPTVGCLATVCTGALIVAHAGIMKGRRATTHHAAFDDLAATGAVVVAERVVDDGDLVTCGGVTSGIDLALWLVEREVSADLADEIARHLEHDRWRPPSP